MPTKRVAILGSTGSVGTQALQVVERHPERLEVVALAAGDNDELLAAQIERFAPRLVCMASAAAAERLRERIGAGTELVWGDSGLSAATVGCDADVVLNAVVGAAGLAATYEAVGAGIDVALANKESLVMAGDLITSAARASGATLLPVDSEPNALHQCLRGAAVADVRRLVLTASGGPFRDWSPERLTAVTPAEALQHPTWSMGPRITVDSATLMNKGFEVIETRWLFDIPADRIDVVIHPQSIVHSLIEMIDGSLIAHAGPTDMRLPIQDALSFPERWEPAVEALRLSESSPWTFEPADEERYPAIGLARDVLRRGGTAAAVLNAADEVAVQAFLDGELDFDRILAVVAEVVEAAAIEPAESLESVLTADRAARSAAQRFLLE